MDILPPVLLILVPVLLIGVLLFRRKPSNVQSVPLTDAVSTEPAEKKTPSPTPPVNQPNLDTMRMAVEQMNSEQIENLLEMGATLKPGAEALFRQELAKRKSPGSKSEE